MLHRSIDCQVHKIRMIETAVFCFSFVFSFVFLNITSYFYININANYDEWYNKTKEDKLIKYKNYGCSKKKFRRNW